MATITKFLTNSNGKMLVDSTTGKPLSLTMDVVNGLSIRLAERAAVSTTYSTLASYSTTSQTYSNITNAGEFAVGDVAILQWTITDRDNTAGIIFAEVSAVSSNSITAKGLGMSVKGDPGDDGAQVELQVANGQLQWKYDYQESWTNLIAMSELKGDAGDTPEIGDNGNWFVGGNDTGKPSRGANGATPTINSSGEWVIDGASTGVQAEGADALMCVEAIETDSIPTEHDIERILVGYFNRYPNIGDGCIFTYITHSGNPKRTYLAVGECTTSSVEGIRTYYHFLINNIVEIKGLDGQNGQSALGYKSIIDVNSTPYTGQTIDVDMSGFVGDWTIGDLFYGVIRHAYSAATNVYLSVLEIADAFTNCKILSLVKINGESGVNNVTAGTSTEQDGFTITPIKFNFETGNSKTVNVKAKNGQDGATPEIGENGNWFIDGADTGKPSRGEQGDSGAAATVSVGQVTTLPTGSQATVTNSGTPNAAILDFGIPVGHPGKDGQDGATFLPAVDGNGNLSWSNDGELPNPATVNIRGEQGEAATVQVGTTTTLPAGSQATVNNSGTSEAAVLNFGIPKGQDGQGVPAGGTTGQVLKKKSGTDYDTEWGDAEGGGGAEVIDLGSVTFITDGAVKSASVSLSAEQLEALTKDPTPDVLFTDADEQLKVTARHDISFAGLDGDTPAWVAFMIPDTGKLLAYQAVLSDGALFINSVTYNNLDKIEQGGGVEVIDLGTAQLTEEYLGEGLYTGEISISQDNYNKLNADGYSVVKINITGGPLNKDSAPMWLSKRMQTDSIFLSGSVRVDTIEFYAGVLTSKGAGTGYVSFYEKEVFSSGGGGSAEVTKEAIATALNLTTSQLDVLVSLAQKVTITGNDVKFATGTVLKSSYFDAVD